MLSHSCQSTSSNRYFTPRLREVTVKESPQRSKFQDEHLLDPRDDSAGILLKLVMLKRDVIAEQLGSLWECFLEHQPQTAVLGLKEEKPPTLKYKDSSKKIKGFMQLVTEELEKERLGQVCWHSRMNDPHCGSVGSWKW